PAGEIVLLNVQAEKQFGYRRDELVGQQVKNVIPEGFAERLIADGTRSAAEALAQQIGTGIELSGRRNFAAFLSPSPTGVDAADINGDGKVDLVYSNSSYGTVGVLFGNGDGTFGT